MSPISVRCPKCGALPRQRCLNPNLGTIAKPHFKRVEAASEAAGFEVRVERIVATFNAMSTDERADMIRELTEGDQPCGS